MGKMVESCDAGDKAIRRVAEYHGPYELVRVTKAGLCILSNGRSVPPSLIRKYPHPNEQE